jgi:hypothetical protein
VRTARFTLLRAVPDKIGEQTKPRRGRLSETSIAARPWAP